MSGNEKGDVTELRCLAALRELGLAVSVPWGASTGYDLIADADGALYRIQCKTARPIPSGLQFNAYSQMHSTLQRGYEGRADYFMTCFEDRFYLIPVEDCTTGKKTLRLCAAGRVTNSEEMTPAEAYELSAVAPLLFPGVG